MEKTTYVSVIGIDGSGKTTTVELVSRELAKDKRVGVLSSSKGVPHVLVEGKSYLQFPEKFQGVNDLYLRGQESKNTPLIFLSFVKFLLLRERLVRPHMITNYQPDYIICDRDSMVDSHVLFNNYFKNRMPIGLLTYMVEMLTGVNKTDELFLLSLDPEIAFRRIQDIRRLDTHESLNDLQRMAQMYPKIISSMTKMGKVGRWACVNTEIYNQWQASEIIVSALGRN